MKRRLNSVWRVVLVTALATSCGDGPEAPLSSTSDERTPALAARTISNPVAGTCEVQPCRPGTGGIEIPTQTSVSESELLILEETYDMLAVGQDVGSWIASPVQPNPAIPRVQSVSFSSAPNGAELTGDSEALLRFPEPLTGTITVEIWMDPFVGSANNVLRLLVGEDAATGSISVIAKNESDRWFYNDGDGQAIFFEPLDGEGHRVRYEYSTATASFTLLLDLDGDDDFDSADFNVSVVLNPDLIDQPITGVSMNSGRGGIGQTSYFDDLRVWRSE